MLLPKRQQLEQSRPNELDILLLQHELEELTIMQELGYSYGKTHFFEVLEVGGQKKDILKQYFPTAFKYFEDFITRIT